MTILKLFTLLILATNIYANNLNILTIDAINFSANDNNNMIIFNGDVNMTKDKDNLKANKLVIYFRVSPKDSKTKEAILYTATGDVYLEINATKKHYIAKGDKVLYKPLENKYIIFGNGYAEDTQDNRKLYGDIIYIDTLTGEAKIDGSKKKPVRFIMQLDTKDKKQ
jgi:lipopolysaccharide export system protein LptA